MIEVEASSTESINTDNDEFNAKVDNLIEELSNTEIDASDKCVNSSSVCKTCNKNTQDADGDDYIMVGEEIYHSSCFTCDHCSERLLGKFFIVGDQKYCEDHQKVALGKCGRCDDYLDSNSVVVAGKSYHPACFNCSDCQAPIIGKFYTMEDGGWRCDNCWRLGQPRCGICGLPILERMLTVGDARYHPACFTCAQCGAGLEGGQFMEDGDVVICRDCYIRLKAPWCVRCEKVIISEPGRRTTVITCEDKTYHHNCYTCMKCDLNLSGKEVFLEDSNIICGKC